MINSIARKEAENIGRDAKVFLEAGLWSGCRVSCILGEWGVKDREWRMEVKDAGVTGDGN